MDKTGDISIQADINNFYSHAHTVRFTYVDTYVQLKEERTFYSAQGS